MPDNDLADIMGLLQKKRAEHMAQVEQLDKALSALHAVLGGTTPVTVPATKSAPNVRTARPSVRTKALRLMEEEDRDWNAREILDEYARRNDPVHGKNPKDALRTALIEAMKVGLAVRTEPGRYKAAKWTSARRGLTPLRFGGGQL